MVLGQLAIAGGFRNFRARRFHKIKHGLKKTWLPRKIVARHNDAGTAMPFALVIKSKLDFGADLKGPFGQETDTFGRPLDMLLNEIEGVRKTYRDAHSLVSPCFGSDRHERIFKAIFYLISIGILSSDQNPSISC